MSNRERWIIYPLLFMALGLALKPNLTVADRLKCRTLICEEIDANRSNVAELNCREATLGELNGTLSRFANVEIVGPDGNPRIRMGTGVVVAPNDKQRLAGGLIEIYNANHKKLVDLGSTGDGQSGFVATLAADGSPRSRLGSAGGGAILALHDDQRKLELILGHQAAVSGLFAILADGRVDTPWGTIPRAKLPPRKLIDAQPKAPKSTDPKTTDPNHAK
jgi:hypothetical protein